MERNRSYLDNSNRKLSVRQYSILPGKHCPRHFEGGKCFLCNLLYARELREVRAAAISSCERRSNRQDERDSEITCSTVKMAH
jgi:hypothetical protein